MTEQTMPARKVDLDNVILVAEVRPRFDAAIDAAACALPIGTSVGTEALYLVANQAWIAVEVALPGFPPALLRLVELAPYEYEILRGPTAEA